MHFGMRRHTAAGEHPEAQGHSTAYGSAFHEAVAYQADHDASIDEAAQHAFDLFGQWLDPSHLDRLKKDLLTYMDRDPIGVRVVGVEIEVKIPLFVYEGRQIYFRGKIDRLYQSLADPRVFIHRDYKTSAHPKSEEEVHNDIQMWSYNWAIHEVYPECEKLIQEYDQLAFGVLRTGKTDEHRAQVKEWLIRQVTAILRDNKYGEDGLLLPKKNQWCAYCALLESCSVVKDATDFAKMEIAALAPQRKEGKAMVVDLDPSRVEEYVDRLDEVSEAIKILGRYEESVKRVLRDMPEIRRASLGYSMRERSVDVMPPEGMEAAHRLLGDELFYELVSVSKTAIERKVEDQEAKAQVLGFLDRRVGSRYVQKGVAKSKRRK
jgi:hypothetical protein